MSTDINIMGDPTNDRPLLAIDGPCIEGIMTLTQKIMILLLSDQDTETYGTRVPAILRDSANVDPSILSNVFTTAMADVREILDETYLEDTPDDERLDSYVIEVTNTNEDTISVDITITAISGDSTELKMPIDATSKEST
jgi:hypothetical protein